METMGRVTQPAGACLVDCTAAVGDVPRGASGVPGIPAVASAGGAAVKRAVLYARVSSERQAEEGFSLPSQLEACREYAERHGFTVVQEISDDISGSVAVRDRPGGRRVYRMLESVDAVIMYTMDRTARAKREYPLEFFVFLSDIQDAGAELHFVDSGRASGSIVDIISAWKAGQERRDIKERMMRGKRAAAKAGNVLCRFAPFGYRKALVREQGSERKTLEIREGEAETVRMIFRWYTEGDGEDGPMSIRTIRQQLTDMHVPTCTDRRGLNVPKVRGRAEWEAATIGQILRNETYAGTWHYDKISGNPIPVTVPAIIDRQTWEAAQERRSRNKQYSRRNTKYEYLLRRRVRCPDCGRAMTARSVVSRGVRRYYYECLSRYHHRPCSNAASYNARDVDRAAWQQIADWVTNPKALRDALDNYQQQQSEATRPLRERLHTVEGLIETNKRELRRLLDAWVKDDGYMRDLFDQRRQEYETALIEQRDERHRLQRLIAEQELSEERIHDILELAKAVGNGIVDAEEDFSKRQWLVETLETSGELERDSEGRKVLHLHCVLGDARMLIVSATSRRRIRASLSQPTRGESCSSGCPG